MANGVGGLLTKFLNEHPLNIFGNKRQDRVEYDESDSIWDVDLNSTIGPISVDSEGRTYGQAMLQNETSGRKPITGPDGYQYWSDSGERVFPHVMKEHEERRMLQAADGYWYYDDTGERVLPLPEDGRKRNPLFGDNYYEGTGMQDLRYIPRYLDEINPSRAEIERLLQDRKRHQSQKAKDIQNLWKGLKKK